MQIKIWVLCLSPFPLEYLDVIEGRLGARVLLFGVLNFPEMLQLENEEALEVAC